MRRVLVCIAVFAAMAFSPALAVTTIYTDSSAFGAWPNALGAGDSLGPRDGVSATIPNGGWIAYQVSPTFDDGNILFTVDSFTGPGTAFFYVGRSNGAGWFSALSNQGLISLSSGPNIIAATAARQSYCISIGGCDVFIIQAWGGTTFALDRALGPNPEPAAWALMILGFIGVAGRMKAVRKKAGPRLAPSYAA